MIHNQRSSRKCPDKSTSEPSRINLLFHLGTETAREVNKNSPVRVEKGGMEIHLHKPKAKRGAMGPLVYPFQGAQSSAKDKTGHVVLW